MRWAAVCAAVIAAADDILYLGAASSDAQFLRVPFVAGFIALMAICAALSARASATRWRPLLLGISTAGLLLLGIIGIFSIGLPLLLAGLLALVGLIISLSRPGSAPERSGRAAAGMVAGGALLAVVVLLGGFILTELALRCPAHGVTGGSGSSLFGGSAYSCDNGKLTISH
jgi:prepilin signal peptidase PulO-like enzyme (type II secretory pathway)